MSEDKTSSVVPLNLARVVSRTEMTRYVEILARAQNLLAPLLGMYLGQFLLLVLPNSLLWGWIAIFASVGLVL